MTEEQLKEIQVGNKRLTTDQLFETMNSDIKRMNEIINQLKSIMRNPNDLNFERLVYDRIYGFYELIILLEEDMHSYVESKRA